MAGRASKRERILDAAAHIAETAGAAHLTIDAVASAAEISKGGVLYHFPNKRALLEGMLEQLIGTTTRRVAERAAEEAGHRGATIRAWIRTEGDRHPRERAMSMAILAAAAEDPELVDPAREHLARVVAAVSQDSANVDVALVLLFAVEGLRLLDTLHLVPLSVSERERLHGVMLAMAEGGVS